MEYFIYNGKKMAYVIDGNRDNNEMPLVLLNGIMMNVNSWTPFVPVLTKYQQVIRIDMLDQGSSDKMTEQYDIVYQANAVIALLTHLGVAKYNLFGISYGGHVSLNIATIDKERVNKLVLFNCLPNTNELLKDVGNAWNIAGSKNDPELYFYTTIPVIYSARFYSENYEWLASRKPLLLQVFNEDFLTSMDRLVVSSESHDVRNKLKDIVADTLVVASTEDLLTPATLTKTIAVGIPNAKYIEIPNCGHASMYEKPNEFIAILSGFLNFDNIKLI